MSPVPVLIVPVHEAASGGARASVVAPAGNENLSNAAMLARLMRRDEFVGAVALLAASACVEKPRAAPTPSPDAAQTVAPAASEHGRVPDAQTRGDARTPVDAEVDAATAAAASYGAFRRSPRAGCLALAKGSGPIRLVEADLRGSFVDGGTISLCSRTARRRARCRPTTRPATLG